MQTHIAYLPPAHIANAALACVDNVLAALPPATPLVRVMGACRLAARLHCAAKGYTIGTPAAQALASVAVRRYLATGQVARPVAKRIA